MTSRSIVVLIVACGTYAVCADDYVDRADANGDGFVSLYELRAAHFADPEFNRRIEASFERYDRNGDGLISADERSTQGDARAAEAGPAVRDEPRAATKSAAPGVLEPVEELSVIELNDRRRARPVGGGTASWVSEIDTDRSGGASMAELTASGGGDKWFLDSEFKAADRNGDGDLDATELAALVQTIELRQRARR